MVYLLTHNVFKSRSVAVLESGLENGIEKILNISWSFSLYKFSAVGDTETFRESNL